MAFIIRTLRILAQYVSSLVWTNLLTANQSNVEGGHFLTEDVGLFDAAFFNFSSELAAVGASSIFQHEREG